MIKGSDGMEKETVKRCLFCGCVVDSSDDDVHFIYQGTKKRYFHKSCYEKQKKTPSAGQAKTMSHN